MTRQPVNQNGTFTIGNNINGKIYSHSNFITLDFISWSVKHYWQQSGGKDKGEKEKFEKRSIYFLVGLQILKIAKQVFAVSGSIKDV